ncbi:methionine ABC transporter ATP-binding protein [Acidisphaera sp. L21]|uniref:methionine ABC transporter ATP-binding protein n=1 Tax=Acidisphaera sp. L21 TaxID=1641851 RepID=UPI00131DDBE5|nr:ATP-binding cassette domain-containing protein [Acidisphaera sp. L21]
MEVPIAAPPPLVRLDGIRKSYGRHAPVLDDVSIAVQPGEIFGIVGRSGAGKSTLLRCVNLLERPDAGRVDVAGQDMLALDPAALRTARRGIGMVFQHFNLLSSLTVAANIAFPLAIAGTGRTQQRERVRELLGLVGLTDKAEAYPRQLSGGQKQRVGIARALASRPSVLLCDEATSALDPETTGEILDLIRGLRDRLSLTVLLITHEMAVVKTLCDRVAILDRGRLVETGAVFDVFTRPRSAIARRFVAEVIGDDVPPGAAGRLPPPADHEECRVLRILFAGPNSTRAVISEVSRRFRLDLNIMSGRIDEIGGEPFGLMAVAAYGEPAQIDAGMAWMQGLGLDVTVHS